MLYPEVQRKAQAEIDSVLGRDGGLPDMQTRPKLPYLEAVFKEVLRIHPVTPLGSLLFALCPCYDERPDQAISGFPHASSEDDILNGYVVPKATVIMVNVW